MDQRPDAPSAADTTKRGRGRPRSPAPLTPAQRAKRYRDKKKRAQQSPPAQRATGTPATGVTENNRDVTLNTGEAVGRLEARLILTNAENIGLSDELEAARDRVRALGLALAEALHAHAGHKRLPAERLRALAALLAPRRSARKP